MAKSSRLQVRRLDGAARSVGRATNVILRRFNVKLARLDRSAAENQDFYEPPRSCQIPNLGFLYELEFGRIADGYFVEVGAYDGETFSNSSFLADLGWQGVLIEPVPQFADACRERHRGNNVLVVERAVGSASGSVTLQVAGGLSSTNEEQIHEYSQLDWAASLVRGGITITVQMSTLDELLLEANAPVGLELLVVDVEGGESAVFEGFDLDRWRPKMMIVELSDAHPGLTTTRASDARLCQSIVESGYRILYKDMVNTIFVDSREGRAS